MEKAVRESYPCAMPGRIIHDNIHTIHYFLEQVGKSSGKGVALLNLSQSKAFDRVDHTYLMAVLQASDLGLNFCRWITALYGDIESVVKVNCFFSHPFRIALGPSRLPALSTLVCFGS